jgi:hypothetical protein
MSDELAVQQVLAHYVRAHDRRDGAAMARLFTLQGRVEIFYNNAGELEPLGELTGREAIADAVVHMMKPHPPREWSHNAIDGLLIEIDGRPRDRRRSVHGFQYSRRGKTEHGLAKGRPWRAGHDHPDRVGLLPPESCSRERDVAD